MTGRFPGCRTHRHLALVGLLAATATACSSEQRTTAGPSSQENDALVLFVHGLGGDAVETWRESDSVEGFLDLVNADSVLGQQYDVAAYSYPTSVVGPLMPAIDEIAQGLRTEIEQRYARYESISLVGHSMGGLVARRYLLNEIAQGRPLRVDKLALYAVPNTGSQFAEAVRIALPETPQVLELQRGSDFLYELNQEWLRSNIRHQVRVKYVSGGRDVVVPPPSSRPPWAVDTEVVVDATHSSIVKPTSADDLAFQILHRFLDQSRGNYALVDMAHGQSDWTGFTEGIDALRRAGEPLIILDAPVEQRQPLLDRADVLVMAVPRKATLAPATIRRLDSWVAGGRGLLLLGYYAAQRHHENNINELVAEFGVELDDNLLLPNTLFDSEHARTARLDSAAFHSVLVPVPPGLQEQPLFSGVEALSLWTSGSVLTRDLPGTIVLNTPDSVGEYRFRYAVPNKPEDPYIRTFYPVGEGAAPVVIAKCHGAGRVVAVGTWRVVSLDTPGNREFVRNAMSWLSTPEPCEAA